MDRVALKEFLFEDDRIRRFEASQRAGMISHCIRMKAPCHGRTFCVAWHSKGGALGPSGVYLGQAGKGSIDIHGAGFQGIVRLLCSTQRKLLPDHGHLLLPGQVLCIKRDSFGT